MPTFCRHNRFLERCPVCSKTLPGAEQAGASARGRRAGGAGSGSGAPSRRDRRPHTAAGLRVRHESRALDDGFRSDLVPGLRASGDAGRLAQEIAFAAARLGLLATAPPGLYGAARGLGASDLERALWICFLCAYLCPIEGADPFAGIRQALERIPAPGGVSPASDLDGIPLGPRTSHDPARGATTLVAYREWVRRAGGGSAASAFTGDPSWSPQRRFERIHERLKLPGLAPSARYELLVTFGRLGLVAMSADGLHLHEAQRSVMADEATVLAAKRVFGIGDGLLLERRADALARAASVPIEALDPALASWGSGERASLGVPADASDAGALERVRFALGL